MGRLDRGETDDERSGRFVPTSWSLVERAAGGSASALEELAMRYWKPVYVYLRRKGLDVDDAADGTQDFFLHVLGHEFVGRARREKGRFRSYLLAILEHQRANEARVRGAAKRGRGRTLPLDPEKLEPWLADSSLDPARAFHRQWALDVLARAMAALAAELGEPTYAVHRLHLAPAGRPPPYRESAARLGLSEAAFTSALHRSRRRLRALVLDEAGEGLDDLLEFLR